MDCSREYRKYFMGIEFFESLIGFFSLIGLYFLFRELKESEQEIKEAKLLLDKANSIKKKFPSKDSSFWQEVLKQFDQWKFTEAEREIAIMILRGMTNLQISALRNKSIKTIENQMFSIYQKSSTTGKLEFIAFFLSGLIPEED